MKYLLVAFLTILLTIPFSPARASDTPAIGAPAPEFRLQDQNGEWHALEDYKGQWLTVYFYPKDDTPGCTAEACNFRDNIYAFKKIGAAVVGISVDDVESHKAFSDKYKIPFTILADNDQQTAANYGVLKNYALLKLASRQSFIIDPTGRVAKHYKKVNPDTHTEEVLQDLQQLMSNWGSDTAS